MQFKHPEILYFLALLIIPIFIHLFQLQKFVKVPFTNVAFLQQISQQTRKSSRLKKWLVLATRLLLFSALLFAFSQPYFSSKTLDKKQQTFIYLDNSLSTNTEGEKGNLLKVAAQEIIENTSQNDIYTLLTNSIVLDNITKNELKKELLSIKNTSIKMDIDAVLLKMNSISKTKSNTLYKNILISDFQNINDNKFTNVTSDFSLIKLQASLKNNISIDSTYIEHKGNENYKLYVVVKNQGETKNNIPIALYSNTKLINKQSFSIEKNSQKTVEFSIGNSSPFLGKIEVTFSDIFEFDNTYFFTLHAPKKIKVLTIGKTTNFLSRIYTKNTYRFVNSTLQNVNYNSIPKQQLIILNELEKIPQTLQLSLVEFSKKGGNIVVIPNEKIDLNSYNSFFKKLNIGKINQLKKGELKITNIHYKHPLLENVFSKKVHNFQYPTIKSYYTTQFTNASKILSFENNQGFIKKVSLKNNTLFWVASSLKTEHSNFINSSLIVPIFDKFGQTSLQTSKLQYTIGKTNTIDVDVQLEKDKILTIRNKQNSFIPLQQTFQKKVKLTTKEQPSEAGFFTIEALNKPLQHIAFNYPKEESILDFLDFEKLSKNNSNITTSWSIPSILKELNKKNEVHWLWKWFLGMAIVSLLLEILILKFLKP